MKKLILSLVVLCVTLFAWGQDEKMIEKVASLKDQWEVDGDENIVLQRIIDLKGVNKDAIFNAMEEFMAVAYKDANEVIQTRDKASGLLIGKGIYVFYVSEIFAGSGIKQSVWHILKAEAKDERVRLTVTLDRIQATSDLVNTTYPLTRCYPIKEIKNKSENRRSGYVFYYAVKKGVDILESAEKALLKTTSDDW